AEQHPPHPLRVAVDAAPPARPGELADATGEALRALGRPVARVSARWFWRQASLRLEYGRHDAAARYERWLDTGALRREVLDRLGPGGDFRFLPSLWDPERDRATRAGYQQAEPRTVLLLDGALLLGTGLPFDVTVHIRLSAGALRRRTPPGDAWMLPAFERYDAEARPARHADVLVLGDDPAHPAARFGPATQNS
ncbi:MAG TPA: hypothetical protein VIS06_04190, partial [Mycobacteriales bacterium]